MRMEVYEWAQNDPRLRVVERKIPQLVLKSLPGVDSLTLIDIGVKRFFKVPKARVVLGEDQIYAESEEIRRRIARGNSFIRVQFNDGTCRFLQVLRGLCKFTGNESFDEDVDLEEDKEDEPQDEKKDFRAVWRRFFLDSLSTATCFYRTEKANGEAGHLGFVELGKGIHVFVVGSKNCHMILPSDLDQFEQSLIAYQDLGEMHFAEKIARMLLKTVLKDLDSDKLNHLCGLLKKECLTLNFECMFPDSQHIVDYKIDESHPGQCKLICFTSWKPENSRFGLCYDFVQGLDLAHSLGIESVSVLKHEMIDLDETLFDIRQEKQSEGSVIYFLSESRCIGMWKVKSFWYIFIRAIREKILRWNVDRIAQRCKEIQSWLKLSDKQVSEWSKQGLLFACYVKQTIRESKLSFEELESNYATCWSRFIASDFSRADEELLPHKSACVLGFTFPKSFPISREEMCHVADTLDTFIVPHYLKEEKKELKSKLPRLLKMFQVVMFPWNLSTESERQQLRDVLPRRTRRFKCNLVWISFDSISSDFSPPPNVSDLERVLRCCSVHEVALATFLGA